MSGDIVNFVYHVRTDHGWSEPLSYEQAVRLAPDLTEAKWRRLEALESTIGRAHEADTP